MKTTGYKDKNGKDICEGDIVFINTNNTKKKLKNFIIKWSNKEGMFSAYQIHKSYLNYHPFGYLTRHLDVCEVIGNRFENPELLKPKSLRED